MIQNKKTTVVREAAILTTSYVAGTVIDTEGIRNQLIIYYDFTIGSLTDARIQVEFADQNLATSTWYQETASSIAAGVDTISPCYHKITATGKGRIAINVMDRYVKISAIGTGTVAGSSMAITGVVGEA